MMTSRIDAQLDTNLATVIKRAVTVFQCVPAFDSVLDGQ
jgi:hypothetical protein